MITAESFRSQYDGNDTATEFAYGFPVRDKAHVLVTRTDAEGVDHTLAVDADYVVGGVGSGDPATWKITYPVSGDPLPAGERLTITPNLPLKQLTAFDNQGGFFPENHEAAFDYLTLICQQLKEALDRAVKLAMGDTRSGDEILADLDSYVAAAALSASTAAQGAVSSQESAALAEAAAEGVGVVRGMTSRALTSGTVSLTAGVDKLCQKFTGNLSGAAAINLVRAGAVEGSRFQIRLSGVGVSAANPLTIQENGAGSLLAWAEAGTLTGTLTFLFNGAAWELLEGGANLA